MKGGKHQKINNGSAVNGGITLKVHNPLFSVGKL